MRRSSVLKFLTDLAFNAVSNSGDLHQERKKKTYARVWVCACVPGRQSALVDLHAWVILYIVVSLYSVP